MVRELIDSELDTVAGGLADLNVVLQSINATQTATANANGIGFFGFGVGGVATAANVGGTNVNSSVIS
jgi:aconitase A